MNPTPQKQTAPVSAPAASAEMTDFDKLLAKEGKKEMVFVPFGDQDRIKLTPKIIAELICVRTKKGHTCTENDALKFMMMCQAKRLNPFAGDAYMIGYDTQDGPKFSLITAHQAFLKRAEMHPEFDGMESGIILLTDEESGTTVDRSGDFHMPNEVVVGGWATVHFKNRKFPIHRRVRMSRFKKGFGVWLDDAAGMIVKCGEADSLRSAFPTMVGGLYLREEMDFMPDMQTMSTSKPLFESPMATATARKRKEEPTPENTAKFEPEEQGHPEPTPEPPNPEEPKPLKQLRHLLKVGGCKEAELLEYWTQTGATDGSHATLEEVFLALPTVVTETVNRWPDVDSKIKEMRGGGQ